MSLIRPAVITAPTIEPATLAEAKVHLRVADSFTADDAYITALITAAREYCEYRTDKAFLEQTLEWCVDYWPAVYLPSGYARPVNYSNAIELPRAKPLQSVSSLTYKDSGGVITTMVLNTDYIADTDSEPGRILPPYGQTWPSFTPWPANAIRIRYVAGETTSPLSFPQCLVQAMYLLIGHWYENREGVSIGQNVTIESKAIVFAVDALLGVYVPPDAYVL